MKYILFLCCSVVLMKDVQYACNDADTARATNPRAVLVVHSNIVGVHVFVDTISVGIVPLINVQLEQGTHILRYTHPDARSWMRQAIIETVDVHSADTIERQVSFPAVYHVTSEPYGAAVRFNDTLLGETPCVLSFPSAKGILTLSKEGYHDERVMLPEEGTEVYTVLVSTMHDSKNENPLSLSNQRTKNMQPVILAAGTAVLTGAASAYFKIKSDGYYDEYRATGNPGTLDRVRRLDTAAGITLIASELSLLALSYFLLSR